MTETQNKEPAVTAIIGASGAIGSALVEQCAGRGDEVYAFSRSGTRFADERIHEHQIDLEDEASIQAAAAVIDKDRSLDLVIIASGVLHTDTLAPEKSLRDLSAENLQRSFAINTIGPALVAKHFLGRMQRRRRSVFAALSARVGSIGDNRLGGWYGYRTSKAALNMFLKTASLEAGRMNRHLIVAGLHPGTVDSRLSAPFQANVPEQQLVQPETAARNLLAVIAGLRPEDSGNCFAWDGQAIPF